MNLLIFPNQLFKQHPGLKLNPDRVILIEDSLFFGDSKYPMRFHKQKIWLHRATMKRYESWLHEKGFETTYLEYDPKKRVRIGDLLKKTYRLRKSRLTRIACTMPTDFMLEKRLVRICEDLNIEIDFLPSPMFINSSESNFQYRAGKKRWFMADFYKWQRTRLDILMVGDQPEGGKWSFDEDNRKKVPKKLLGDIPSIPNVKHDEFDQAAVEYVEKKFTNHPGSLEKLYYPTSHAASTRWLKNFLTHRFENFGAYEDAIVEGESWMWHSVLTPMLNVGLLTPQQILKATLDHAAKYEVPINSLEGFVRQVIGWREFMRATYEDLGVQMRTRNHWNHVGKIPSSFYEGTTGILPIDDSIQRILATGYCHHIERLMVLGGFMFLCEFDPDEIYRWFMEMFVDSYDWVMVPNVYAMSQHADGGMITTKPYFSGSSYVRKMSHYAKGPWCEIWDGLYWRWIWKHSDELAKNPRWAMMCSTVKKMDEAKRNEHLRHAEEYLASLRG